jgi:hypothetical protein
LRTAQGEPVIHLKNLDTVLRGTSWCRGRGFGDGTRGHGNRSRICASARFPQSQTGRKSSWQSNQCNATVDFKVGFKKQRAAVNYRGRHTPRAEEGERLQIIQAG